MQRSVVMMSTDDLDDDRRLTEVSSLMFVDFDHTPDAVGGNSFLVSELVCLLPLAITLYCGTSSEHELKRRLFCSGEDQNFLGSIDLDYHS
jgi:hypothetical protein